MSDDATASLRVLDGARAQALERVCDALVPGSARVGPAVYIDAVLAQMPGPVREGALAAIDTLGAAAAAGDAALAAHAATPDFLMLRALACEAFYSDFVAPGRDVAGAWDEIDFRPPTTESLRKDWSFLGIAG